MGSFDEAIDIMCGSCKPQETVDTNNEYIYALRFQPYDYFHNKDDKLRVEGNRYYNTHPGARLKDNHRELRDCHHTSPYYGFVYIYGEFVSKENCDDILRNLKYQFYAYYKFGKFAKDLSCILLRIPKSIVQSINFVDYEEHMFNCIGEKLSLDNYKDLEKKYQDEYDYCPENMEILFQYIDKEFIIKSWRIIEWENPTEIPIEDLFPNT